MTRWTFLIVAALFVVGATTSPAQAADPKPFTGAQSQWNGFAKFDFNVGDLKATVVAPAKPHPGRPWLWRGEFFGAFAEADVALVKDGWHLAYLSVPDLFGSPKAVAHWEKFYAVLTKEHGLHPKPGLIGMSRGGLYCLNWAAAHPDQTLAVWLDNAVCDFKSWPGGKRLSLGKSEKGSEGEWKKVLDAYGFKTDAEAIAYKLNPVDNLAPVAKAKIPLLLVYGDSDLVVPHLENSEIVFTRYKALGGPVERIVKPGQDHHPHSLKDVAPIVKFFNDARQADANRGAPGEVSHTPKAPKPDTPVLVTARLGAGTTRPVLKLQTVAPGKYIRKSDPEYEQDWTEFPLRDDGKEGDAKAGDGVWSFRVPGAQQKHRWLLRYRVLANRADGSPVQAPKVGDECPNLAWFCDAGPAAWTGAREPGKPPTTFPAEFLGTLQSLTLLAKADDVARSQWDGGYHKKRLEGALVYQGVVYDHILFSNRGQGSAHICGKNKWGLKFNKGHDLPFVDHAGAPFPAPLDSLNLNPGGSTPYLPIHRGIAGLDEVLSMRAYRLAGVPSPPVTWVQWRVIDDVDEISTKDQYAADLWGLYVALGDMEPELLTDRKLPNGLTVSIQSGIKNAPDSLPEAPKLWEKFIGELRGDPNEAWCRKNLDLPAYYSFHGLNRLLGNVDVRPDGNHGYYRHADGRWAPIPWDNDMMFVPRHHQPGHIDAIRCLKHPAIALECRNRCREMLDLFTSDATERGGQVGQLVADLGSAVAPKNQPVTWAKLDEAMWNQHPRMNQKGSYYLNPSEANHFGGSWRRTLATNDFAGFQRYLVEFCTDSRPTKNYAPNDGDQRGYGWGYLAHEARDDKIPATAEVKRLPAGKFKFEASAFASPKGHAPAALEWRVGRIGKPGWYELEDRWRQESGMTRSVDVPSDVFKEPGEYRVRARWRDATGRYGHWSAPVAVAVK